MESLWTLIAGGLATLFVVAVAVAWWEHLERNDRRPPPFETPRGAPATLDLDLDEPADPATGGNGRQAALDNAYGRLSLLLDAPAAAERAKPAGWADTKPVILNPADLGGPAPAGTTAPAGETAARQGEPSTAG